MHQSLYILQFGTESTELKGDGMHSRVPRAMLQVYEPIVLVGYSAPELQTVCNRLGLVADRMSYYAVRAAALGPVSAEVVAALFYHHSVDMVSPSIPAAWSIASPEQIVAARFEAVDGALRRLLPQQMHSADASASRSARCTAAPNTPWTQLASTVAGLTRHNVRHFMAG